MELPALMEVFTAMLGSEKLQGFAPEPEKLTVRVTSFSFHRGLPSDDTGHGGGFVFDARSLPNPGREEQYKPLTGKDAPVAEYLNQQESVHQYFSNVKALVDASVSSYQARGFKNLAVSFGCTGGPASVGVSGRANGEALARAWGGGGAAASRTGRLGPMKAMVLAAGLGTRLRPLTDARPKALVEINGRTLLEITLARLRGFGVREVIVNVHHFADLVVSYLAEKQNFGMRIEVSREDVLLDTGGGLKKAAWFFREDGGDEPFLLHNVDVISDIDLAQMVAFHRSRQALATLAVQERRSSRQLLFDERWIAVRAAV